VFVLLLSEAALCADPPQRVLIVHSFGRDFAPFSETAQQFRAELSLRSPHPVEYLDIPLELGHFDTAQNDEPLLAFIAAVYAADPPDLVVPIGVPALQFCMRNSDSLFPHAPRLVLAVEQRRLTEVPADGTWTFLCLNADIVEMLRSALTLFPKTRHVYCVWGSTPHEQFWEAEFQERWAAFEDRLQIHWLSDLTLEQMKEQVSSLPADSLVFSGVLARDAAGMSYEHERGLAELHEVANAPMFGYARSQLGLGIVGGPLLDFRAVGTKAADAAVLLLDALPVSDDLLHPETLSPPTYDWRELARWNVAGGSLPAESVVRFHERSLWEDYRWSIIAGVSLCLAEALLIAALFMQRRRRRVAELAAREREQRVQMAADAADAGIWSLDLRTGEIWASERARQLYGFTPTDAITYRALLDRVHPDDRPRIQAEIDGAKLGHPFRARYRVLLPDSEERRIRALGGVAIENGDKPKRLIGVSLDVTEQEKVGEEAARRRAEVAHLSRVVAVGQLASSLAHEISQPLGAILRNAEAAELLLKRDPPDLEELSLIIDDICRDDRRAGEVIERMRALLRRQKPTTTSVNLVELVRDTISFMRPEAAARRIRIEMEVANDVPSVTGDPVHLQQILINLMLNAMEAVDVSDPTRRERLVTVGLRHASVNQVEMGVVDNGPGIPAEMLPRLSEPFFTTKSRGIGMGLAISRALAEAHGGRLDARNEPGGGAAVWVCLPVAIEGVNNG
jgi:signal transduction histidine kinase